MKPNKDDLLLQPMNTLLKLGNEWDKKEYMNRLLEILQLQYYLHTYPQGRE